MPFDVEGFAKDQADGKAEAATSDKYFGKFHPTKFFLPGPAGYDATFTMDPGDAPLATRYGKPIVIEITGAAFIYDLDGPDHQEVFPPSKELEALFPGMKRILREAHVRYVFQRYGVPYVLSIQCYDQRAKRGILTCKQADPIAEQFLKQLKIAGGAPAKLSQPKFDLSRPAAQSDFTYYGPGDLIENTGWHKLPGRTDYHVYARMRFPIAYAPAYVKSQSFMPWGDCYHTGTVGRTGKKGAHYHCKLNDKPLVFDESAAENFTYPWRDNFCELRDFLVGQCPGGYGHQGEDIRPGNCVLNNAEADRCVPYQHDIAAVEDGIIRRMPGRSRRLHRRQRRQQSRPLPLSAHESEDARCRRHRERPAGERRRDPRQGRRLGRLRERHLLPHPFQHPGVHQCRLGLGQPLHDTGCGL